MFAHCFWKRLSRTSQPQIQSMIYGLLRDVNYLAWNAVKHGITFVTSKILAEGDTLRLQLPTNLKLNKHPSSSFGLKFNN